MLPLQQGSQCYGKGSHCSTASGLRDQSAQCWSQESQRWKHCTRETGTVCGMVAVMQSRQKGDICMVPVPASVSQHLALNDSACSHAGS